jgi:hypothetical protein
MMDPRASRSTRDCLDPWTYVEIRVSGGIAPCCVRAEVGNLRDGSLSDILNGPAIRRLRADLLRGTLDRACARCKQRADITPAALRQKVRALLAEVRRPAHDTIEDFRRAVPEASESAVDAFNLALLAARVPGAAVGQAGPVIQQVPFSTGAYLEANPDLKDDSTDMFRYFSDRGMRERRPLRLRGSDLPEDDGGPAVPFDAEQYVRVNPDVLRAGVNPLAHYLKHGRYERRRLC